MDSQTKVNWHNTYINVARLISEHSKAERKKVGAILVKQGRIISTGYNGTPSGFDNNCEDEEGNTKKEVLHAESNAIAKCARSVESSEDADLYITVSPCIECTKLIIQCGIKRVFFSEYYRDISSLELLKQAGILYEKI
jgi:dCMP deaminase